MHTNTVTGVCGLAVPFETTAVIHQIAAESSQMVLEGLHDSYNGFKQCATDVEDTAMKLAFNKIAVSRCNLISQLSNIIRVELDVEPVKSGSALAAAHRTWIDVKSWFTHNRDKQEILNEIHREENVLIGLYETAIEDPYITAKVRDLLDEQLRQVKEENVSIRAL